MNARFGRYFRLVAAFPGGGCVGAPLSGPPWWRALVAWWRARRAAPWPEPGTCPVCRHLAHVEDRYLDAVVDFIGDPQFARAYAGSAGLCRPHLARAVTRPRARRELGELVSWTLARWEAARQALARTPGPGASPDKAEAPAWVRAVELLAGAPGVLDRRVRPRAARGWSTPAGRRPRAAAGVSEIPADVERGKLALRVHELTQQLNEVSSRAAALHYRLAQVAEDRNRLELSPNAEQAANRLAMQTIDDLRAELARLRGEPAPRRSEPVR